MDPYDRTAWDEIRARRERARRWDPRALIPERVREAGTTAARRGKEALDEVPGSVEVQEALRSALEGLTRTIGATAAASVSMRRVCARYRRRGYAVERVEDIQALDLAVCDAVFPRRRRLAYIGASMAEGGWAGAATTVGEAEALVGGVAGAGAGGVPGAMTVAGVLAADAAATLAAGSRLVAETAALYGYDPNDPREQLVMSAILAGATASTEAGKLAAHRELHRLVYALARNASWQTLNRNQLTKVVAQVYRRLGERLTKQQLGKLAPIIGIGLGAGMNAALMHRLGDEAYFAYRERRLQERYDFEPEPVDSDAFEVDPDDDDVVDIVDLVEREDDDEDQDDAERPPAG